MSAETKADTPMGGNRSSRASADFKSSASPSPQIKHAAGPSSSSKRQRVHYSCTECHRRKQKCNRETPCQHCIARKVPERCRVFQPGEDPGDLNQRIDRLERCIESGFANVFSVLEQLGAAESNRSVTTARAARHGQESSRVASPEPRRSPEPAARPSSRRKRKRTASPSNRVGGGGQQRVESQSEDDEANERGRLSPETGQFTASGAVAMKISNLLDSLSAPAGTSKDGQSSNTAVTEPIRSVDLNSQVGLDQLLYEYGAPDSLSRVLLGALPPRELADALIDHFYDDVNWLRQPLPQRMYRRKFAEFWDSGPTLSLENLNIFAGYTSVLALAMLSFTRTDLVPDDPRLLRLIARRLQYVGRRALYTSTMLGREDPDQVVAWITCARFLLLDRRIPEGWTCAANAVKAAHSIGLHRDGDVLGLPPDFTHFRRQIWSAVHFLDRTLSMNLGRPSAIDDRFCDSKAPSDEIDDKVFPHPLPPPSSLGLPSDVKPPTPLTYTRLRHGLGKIMGRIITAYQTVEAPVHYGEILAIDEELEAYRDSLPPWYHAELVRSGPEAGTLRSDRSLDEKLPFLPAHRFLLLSEIDFIRIALHRPYLLRSAGKNGSRFMPSRLACIESAHHDILLRHEFVRNVKAHAPSAHTRTTLGVHIGTHKWFNSLLICGLASLLDPLADEAPIWRRHLEEFVEIMRTKKPLVRDDMREREASIAALFLAKIDEVRQGKLVSGTKRIHADGPGAAAAAKSRDRKASKGPMPPKKSNSTGSSDVDSGLHQDHDTDPHTTAAGLLLGLGQQHARGVDGGAQPLPSPADGNRKASSDGGVDLERLSRPAGSGMTVDERMAWEGRMAGVAPTLRHRESSLSGAGQSGAQPSPAATSQTGGNSSSDDAQAMLEAWYRADMAAGGSVFDAAFSQQPPVFGAGLSSDTAGTGGVPTPALSTSGPGAATTSGASAPSTDFDALAFSDINAGAVASNLMPPTSIGAMPTASSSAADPSSTAYAAPAQNGSVFGAWFQMGTTPSTGPSGFANASGGTGPGAMGYLTSVPGSGVGVPELGGPVAPRPLSASSNGASGRAGTSSSSHLPTSQPALGVPTPGGVNASPGAAATAVGGMAGGGGQAPGSGAAIGVDSFDPGFWQNLINKISA